MSDEDLHDAVAKLRTEEAKKGFIAIQKRLMIPGEDYCDHGYCLMCWGRIVGAGRPRYPVTGHKADCPLEAVGLDIGGGAFLNQVAVEMHRIGKKEWGR